MKSGIIYHGPSLYDGAPIVVIGTFTKSNSKTGGVVQTYILRDDIDPRDASKGGQDVSICGSCPHRGEVNDDPARKIAKGRTCYVNLGQGVLITWLALQRGVYPDAQDATSRAAIGAGRVVRVGTYGGSSSSAARDLDRPAARRGKLDSLYTFQRVASGHCNAKRRQLSRCGATLESWTSHFPRGHRCGAHRSNKRDPMSSVQGSRSAHHLRSLPPMWWHIYKITKINRDPHALGVAQRTTTGLGQWPRPKSRGTRICRPAPRSAALARVPEPITVDPDPTTPTKASRPDPTGPDPDNLGPTRPDPRIVVPNQLT